MVVCSCGVCVYVYVFISCVYFSHLSMCMEMNNLWCHSSGTITLLSFETGPLTDLEFAKKD